MKMTTEERRAKQKRKNELMRLIHEASFELAVLTDSNTPISKMGRVGQIAFNTAKIEKEEELTIRRIQELGISGIKELFYSIGFANFVDNKLIPALQKRPYLGL